MGHVPEIQNQDSENGFPRQGSWDTEKELRMDPKLTRISKIMWISGVCRKPYFPQLKNMVFENGFPQQGSRDTAHKAYIPYAGL